MSTVTTKVSFGGWSYRHRTLWLVEVSESGCGSMLSWLKSAR